MLELWATASATRQEELTMRKNDKYFIAGALVLGAAVSIMVYAGKNSHPSREW